MAKKEVFNPSCTIGGVEAERVLIRLFAFMWLTSSYYEMGFGAGIKKSASRIINHSVRMAELASRRICTSCHTRRNSEEPKKDLAHGGLSWILMSNPMIRNAWVSVFDERPCQLNGDAIIRSYLGVV
jgi:hypothetical protein